VQSLTEFWKTGRVYFRENCNWLLFFLITSVIAVSAWHVLYLDWVKVNIIGPYAIFIARVCGKLLQLFINNVQVEGAIVGQPSGFAMLISAKCTGLFQAVFLVAGIIATPARVFQKLNGIILGAILLSVINLLRLFTIFLVGCYAPQYLNVYHDIIWEALMIVLTFFIWHMWRKLCIKKNVSPAAY
jgi:exosortase/archaeosortase family protein